MADPLRHPGLTAASLASSAGSFPEKLLIARLKQKLSRASESDLYQKLETSTRDALSNYGFSESIIQNFFIPFYSGIFLENELATSSRMYDFVFKSFSRGHAALPAGGMAAIPLQLSAKLKPARLRLQTRVLSIDTHSVSLENGETLSAK